MQRQDNSQFDLIKAFESIPARFPKELLDVVRVNEKGACGLILYLHGRGGSLNGFNNLRHDSYIHIEYPDFLPRVLDWQKGTSGAMKLTGRH